MGSSSCQDQLHAIQAWSSWLLAGTADPGEFHFLHVDDYTGRSNIKSIGPARCEKSTSFR